MDVPLRCAWVALALAAVPSGATAQDRVPDEVAQRRAAARARAAPTVAAPEPDGFTLRDVLDGATPAGYLRDDVDVRASLDGGAVVLAVADDDAPFRWRVEPRGGSPLAILTIEDEGGRFEPLHGAAVEPVEGRLTLDRVRQRGDSAVVEYAEGQAVRWTARGRTLSVELTGGFATRVDLGGLRANLPLGARAQVLQVPFVDHGAVAVVRLGDGRVRYLSAWFDPVLGNATRLAAREPGARGPDGQLLFAQVASYLPSTAKELRPLRERFFVTWSDSLLDVLPSQRRPASAGRVEAGGRFYLDVHRTPFDDVARELRQLAAAGVRDVTVWLRRWQRDGYGAGYPTAVLPPREAWGGADGLDDVRRAAGAAGWDFALGHNWVFNTERRARASALDSDGSDAYRDDGAPRLRPVVAVDLVGPVERALHASFDTRGSFSEAITAVYPTVDLDARNPDWGLLREALVDWGAVLDTVRDVHGGILAGDGALRMGNLFWAGVVDTLEGRPGMVTEAASPATLGVHVPIVPEYRLRRLHPLCVHAGVGDPAAFLDPAGERWSSGFEPTDRDLIQTLALVYGLAGHARLAGRTTAGDVARDWWAGHAARTHLAAPDRTLAAVDYVDGRERWVTLDGLLAQGNVPQVGDTRVRVTWTDGTRVFANLTPLPWSVALGDDVPAVVLPPMGRLLIGDGIEAGLVVEGGRPIEYARTATSLWVDARDGGAAFDGVAFEGVAFEGVAVDGAVALRFERPGQLEVLPAPDYLLGVTPEGRERVVRTTRIRLDGAWLRERIGPGTVVVRARGLDPATGALGGLGVVPVELDADGSLTLRAAHWQRLGASAFLIAAFDTAAPSANSDAGR